MPNNEEVKEYDQSRKNTHSAISAISAAESVFCQLQRLKKVSMY